MDREQSTIGISTAGSGKRVGDGHGRAVALKGAHGWGVQVAGAQPHGAKEPSVLRQRFFITSANDSLVKICACACSRSEIVGVGPEGKRSCGGTNGWLNALAGGSHGDEFGAGVEDRSQHAKAKICSPAQTIVAKPEDVIIGSAQRVSRV